MLRKETVAPALIAMIRDIQKEPILDGFFLAGGTALALQLGHRESVDIDLFSVKRHDYQNIFHFIQNKYQNVAIRHSDEFSIQAIVNNINIDLVSIKGEIIDKPITEDGITLFGINDISAMKLMAIEGRKTAKDYIDIAYILKEISLERMIENYRQKYKNRDIIGVKKALASAGYVNPYEWENVSLHKKDVYISDIPKMLKDEVAQYNKKHGI